MYDAGVGGTRCVTRCVTSSTDNIMNMHARITVKVECIREPVFCLMFVLYLMFELQGRVWINTHVFFDFTGFQVPVEVTDQEDGKYLVSFTLPDADSEYEISVVFKGTFGGKAGHLRGKVFWVDGCISSWPH